MAQQSDIKVLKWHSQRLTLNITEMLWLDIKLVVLV